MNSNCKQIAVLGSTGSIGRQTLDLIARHADRYRAAVLVAGRQVDLLIEQARKFRPQMAIIADETLYPQLCQALEPLGISTAAGAKAVEAAAAADCVDMVVTATVGYSGLLPTIAAIRAGKDIALANKETMVVAGEYVTSLLKDSPTRIFPVDSEHSAIFQCLLGAGENSFTRIHLTASGGPFRTWDKARMAEATRKEALKHPQWNMGAKITIDSATMMNKGFEMIEACWLFDTDPSKINIVVHPQSIIHSMVEFKDGAVIAQMGHPDMREPIQLALSFPERLSLDNRKLDFAALGTLTFERPDPDRFPCLGIAYDAMKKGGNMPCVMNAANEAAVAAFLADKIRYYDIPDIISRCMDSIEFAGQPGLEDIFASNEEAFARAKDMCGL